MCLSCGHYNGRQVLDLAAEKAKRDARIKLKEERIKGEAAAAAPAEPDVKADGGKETSETDTPKKTEDTGTENVPEEKTEKRK